MIDRRNNYIVKKAALRISNSVLVRRQVDRWVSGWVDSPVVLDEQDSGIARGWGRHVCLYTGDGWMDGWMDGWHGWMDGWMKERAAVSSCGFPGVDY